jgi:hypothetical protein
MIRTIAAAVFALLTVTAPAYAANLIVEDVNLNFGNGNTASGNFGVLTLGVGFAQFLTLSLNSSPLAVSADFYRRSEPCVLRNRRTAIPIPRRPCISPSLSLVRTHHFFGFQRNYVANAPHAAVPTTRLPPSRLIIGEISRHRHKGASAT